MALAQARSERLVDFPTSGEHFEFLSDPDDERSLVFLFSVDPGGGVEQRHHHLHQEEVFRCREGALHITLGDTERVLRPGEEVTIPSGTVHSLANQGDVQTVCDVEYRPAGRNRDWFQLIGAAIATTGKEPGLFDLSPFIGDVGIYIEGPPVPAQRALFAVLKPLAILLGRRRRMLRMASDYYGRAFTW